MTEFLASVNTPGAGKTNGDGTETFLYWNGDIGLQYLVTSPANAGGSKNITFRVDRDRSPTSGGWTIAKVVGTWYPT